MSLLSLLSQGSQRSRRSETIEESGKAYCQDGRRTVSIFREINPDAKSVTAFVTQKPHAGGGVNLTEQNHGSEQKRKLNILRVIKERHAKHQSSYQKFSKLAIGDKNTPVGFISIEPLANAKGVKKICELCTMPGRMTCLKCNVTYYCSDKHRLKDQDIHTQRCMKLHVIRTANTNEGNKLDRCQALGQRNLVSATLLDETFCAAVEELYSGKVESAIVHFENCFREIKQVYGTLSIETITLNSFLMDAFVQNRSFDEARLCQVRIMELYRQLEDQELREAKGSHHKTSQYTLTKALIASVRGKLALAEMQLREASYFFADQIYQTADIYGGNHVRTCSGYFNLGKSFVAAGKTLEASCVLAFCVDIWFDYFRNIFHRLAYEENEITGIDGSVCPQQIYASLDDTKENFIPRFLELEARMQLQVLLDLFNKKKELYIVNKATFSMAIIHFINRRFPYASQHTQIIFTNKAYDMKSADDNMMKLATKLERLCGRRR